MKNNHSQCPVETTLKAIGGRWKLLILRELFSGIKRFSELQRSLEGVTQKMLTQQLREMEGYGIIRRTVYPQVPPKVEYSLTPLGESLKPILDVMHQWGERHHVENGNGNLHSAEDALLEEPRAGKRI